MSYIRITLILCIAAFFVIFSAGCTDNGTVQETVTPTATEVPTTIQTETPSTGSSGEYSLDEDLPSAIGVEVSDSVVDSHTVLVKYDLDLSSMGSAMGQDGWQILVTAYAYNPGKVESEFSVNSYDDIISAGIPYKTSNIHVFPSNVYPGKIEVSTNPDSGMTIDTGDYYVYGIVLRET